MKQEPASEGVVEGTQIPPELEAGGSRTPPPRSRGDLIPPEVIVSAAARFKKRRRFQSSADEVPVSLSSDQMSKQSFDCHLDSVAKMAFKNFMMCALSTRRWAAEERQVKDVISRHQVDQTAHHRLRDEKNVLETELRDVKASYASLMGEMREARIRLVSSEQRLQEVLIEVSASRETVAELRASKDALCLELQAVKEELKNSQAKLEGLKTSSGDLKDFFRGSAALDEVVGDEIFLAMSNLYFFNRSRGIQVDFSAAFHPFTVPDFDNVFPARASAANRGEYL
ncbi:hypothetical protein Peur_035187 [Populus x canadensis]